MTNENTKVIAAGIVFSIFSLLMLINIFLGQSNNWFGLDIGITQDCLYRDSGGFYPFYCLGVFTVSFFPWLANGNVLPYLLIGYFVLIIAAILYLYHRNGLNKII